MTASQETGPGPITDRRLGVRARPEWTASLKLLSCLNTFSDVPVPISRRGGREGEICELKNDPSSGVPASCRHWCR